ncbi:hypothetical protein THZG08_170011 [Vibrio owensii]|nr:hypothetical protein THZG08_170011 [Vibrio owensii]CAH1554864.1 hypothetical protein THOA03_170109 [Vibrio owensii]
MTTVGIVALSLNDFLIPRLFISTSNFCLGIILLPMKSLCHFLVASLINNDSSHSIMRRVVLLLLNYSPHIHSPVVKTLDIVKHCTEHTIYSIHTSIRTKQYDHQDCAYHFHQKRITFSISL